MTTHTTDSATTAVLLRGTQLLDPLTGLTLVELGIDGVWRTAEGDVVNALQVPSTQRVEPTVADVRPRAARRD